MRNNEDENLIRRLYGVEDSEIAKIVNGAPLGEDEALDLLERFESDPTASARLAAAFEKNEPSPVPELGRSAYFERTLAKLRKEAEMIELLSSTAEPRLADDGERLTLAGLLTHATDLAKEVRERALALMRDGLPWHGQIARRSSALAMGFRAASPVELYVVEAPDDRNLRLVKCAGLEFQSYDVNPLRENRYQLRLAGPIADRGESKAAGEIQGVIALFDSDVFVTARDVSARYDGRAYWLDLGEIRPGEVGHVVVGWA